MQVGSGTNPRSEVVTKPFSRCGEHSRCGDREDALEYADEHSEGSYHTLKVAEENMVPLPVQEPTLLLADQSCPPVTNTQTHYLYHSDLPRDS